jgi:phosphinothricin acetyltransferase
MSNIVIRRAARADAEALLAIYNHYVAETHISFDVEPRTLEHRIAWLEGFSATGRYQCFVADRDGRAIGWASSSRFKDRAAYDTSIETSIYLAPGEGGRGLGRRLYQKLFDALSGQDIHRCYGVIGLPNDASVALHIAMGFRPIGTQTEVGRKFGRFWDVGWYEKALI